MSGIADELDQRLKQLDGATAEQLEKLVRDALALVEPTARARRQSPWPEGYFQRTAGALAGEELERPAQGELPQREAW
ncbi:MAG TPA: hypothetical protein VLJ39_18570 [Tepidisphaeraceae bacterium]|nr:hypothetical protein [Tepidisphaeraceae bacterium]